MINITKIICLLAEKSETFFSLKSAQKALTIVDSVSFFLRHRWGSYGAIKPSHSGNSILAAKIPLLRALSGWQRLLMRWLLLGDEDDSLWALVVIIHWPILLVVYCLTRCSWITALLPIRRCNFYFNLLCSKHYLCGGFCWPYNLFNAYFQTILLVRDQLFHNLFIAKLYIYGVDQHSLIKIVPLLEIGKIFRNFVQLCHLTGHLFLQLCDIDMIKLKFLIFLFYLFFHFSHFFCQQPVLQAKFTALVTKGYIFCSNFVQLLLKLGAIVANGRIRSTGTNTVFSVTKFLVWKISFNSQRCQTIPDRRLFLRWRPWLLTTWI